MILKFFELKKKNLDKDNFFLLYGNNTGLIQEIINQSLKPIKSKAISAFLHFSTASATDKTPDLILLSISDKKPSA